MCALSFQNWIGINYNTIFKTMQTTWLLNPFLFPRTTHPGVNTLQLFDNHELCEQQAFCFE
jgi:hypothetical protein